MTGGCDHFGAESKWGSDGLGYYCSIWA